RTAAARSCCWCAPVSRYSVEQRNLLYGNRFGLEEMVLTCAGESEHHLPREHVLDRGTRLETNVCSARRRRSQSRGCSVEMLTLGVAGAESSKPRWALPGLRRLSPGHPDIGFRQSKSGSDPEPRRPFRSPHLSRSKCPLHLVRISSRPASMKCSRDDC